MHSLYELHCNTQRYLYSILRLYTSSVSQVNYDEKNAKGREDVSDYSAQSEESGDESCGEEADLDKPALKASST